MRRTLRGLMPRVGSRVASCARSPFRELRVWAATTLSADPTAPDPRLVHELLMDPDEDVVASILPALIRLPFHPSFLPLEDTRMALQARCVGASPELCGLLESTRSRLDGTRTPGPPRPRQPRSWLVASLLGLVGLATLLMGVTGSRGGRLHENASRDRSTAPVRHPSEVAPLPPPWSLRRSGGPHRVSRDDTATLARIGPPSLP